MKTTTGVIVTLLVCALAGIGALGCNTFRGAGKDIQEGGQAVERAADKAQQGHEHPGPYTIRASTEAGGSISPLGNITVSHRSHRTFTVKANRGYHVADVLVDGKSMGAVRRHSFDSVTADHTIVALFTENPR